MAFSGQQLGRDGEDTAVAFLRARKALIIERNWRPEQKGMRGEIDIIAQVGEFTCFIEVKTRSSDQMGAPQEAVGAVKQKQICRLAVAYLTFKGNADIPCRFDVIEVWLSSGQKPRVQWIENAFDFHA